MTRIAKSVPLKAFDHVAHIMKESAGPDGILSRKDAQKLVKTLNADGRGTEALAAGNLFKMLDMRDSSFDGARVTGRDLTAVKSFVQAKMLDNRDVDNNGFSKAEIARMSETGKALIEIGKMLEAGIIAAPVAGDAKSVAKNLENVAKHITFEGFAGNEGGGSYKAVSFPLPKTTALNAASVSAALHLGKAVKLSSDYDVAEMIAYHKQDMGADYVAGYTALENALKGLTGVKMFVDSNENTVDGKVFILGRLPDGSVAGLATNRIWT